MKSQICSATNERRTPVVIWGIGKAYREFLNIGIGKHLTIAETAKLREMEKNNCPKYCAVFSFVFEAWQ